MLSSLTEIVERSAAPAAVEVALARLAECHPGLRLRLEADEALARAVVTVVSASRSLTRLLVVDPEATQVLADLDRRPPVTATSPEALVRWKRLELLRIAARDLLGCDGLREVGAALARLADDVLSGACALTLGAGAGGLAVIGMGKLGGRELNYASDIDLIFVGEGDPRPVMSLARRCFRVDANLRPEGRSGPLTRSLASYQAYWGRWAEPWELQTLLKARPVAGDPTHAAAFAAAAASWVWGRPFGADELRALRSPNTLAALAELSAAGYVHPSDAAALEAAYDYLRTVEHRLQLADERQVHAVPAYPEARGGLARVMGYRDDARTTALARFDADLRRHQASVRSIHERLYFRPLLEAFAAHDGAMTAEATEARLHAFGFTDAERTRRALQELTRGLTRSSRLMQQMLPLVLGWLSESPDPDLGLLGLRTLAAGSREAPRLVATFRDSPEAARRLCLLLGTRRLPPGGLEQHPELPGILADDDALRPRSREALAASAAATLDWRADPDARQEALVRLKRAEELRIAAGDVLGLGGVEATGAGLSALAEAVLQAALDTVSPPAPMAVVAMGRFGGAELSYASDLDVLLVYEDGSPDDFAAAEASAEALVRLVKGSTPATRLYLLDAGLRPEGRQGPLARSLGSYRAYYRRWAQTWERQALLRARPVAGDLEVGRRFMEVVGEWVWRPLRQEEIREIRRMKARVERERIPPREDPQFHLKLGPGSLSDVEWTAQLLQLRHGVRAPGTMAALARLEEAEALCAADARTLGESYRFCERTRNRWHLIKGAPSDALPTQADQLTRLARSLDTTASELRDRYRKVTRRARQVVERLFYGKSD